MNSSPSNEAVGPPAPVIISNIEGLDLKKYISVYGVYARIRRLEFIADVCPNMYLEALRLAADNILATYDTNTYTVLHNKLVSALKTATNIDTPEVHGDDKKFNDAEIVCGMIEAAINSRLSKQSEKVTFSEDNHQEESRGEPVVFTATNPVIDCRPCSSQELIPPVASCCVEQNEQKMDCDNPYIPELNRNWMHVTNDMIQERFRKIFELLPVDEHGALKRLGDFFLKCGKWQLAVYNYKLALDHCINRREKIEDSLCIIKVAILYKNLSLLVENIDTIETNIGILGKDNTPKVIRMSVNIAIGLMELQLENYKIVPYFLLKDFGLAHRFHNIVSNDDLIVYGGLCMMATLSRRHWKTRLLNPDSPLHPLVSSESSLCEIISKFYTYDFSTSFQLLNGIKDYLLLDMYLAPHVSKLYKHIYKRALVDYTSQFITLKLTHLNNVFPKYSLLYLERVMEKLIKKKEIRMRFDKQNKILYMNPQ